MLFRSEARGFRDIFGPGSELFEAHRPHEQLADFHFVSMERRYHNVRGLIFAELHNQIGEAEAKILQARVILEGANGPVTADGDVVLRERGIDVVPDILANAGGVTVSYYEWVQNGRQETWDLEEVDERLERAMRRAYRRVVEFAREHNCSMRDASYALAFSRIAAVYKQRSIFP